jgi:hypothetical protein
MGEGQQTSPIRLLKIKIRILFMTVFILLAVSFESKSIVGVFNTNQLAVEYAVKYNVSGWHIERHTLYNKKSLKKLMEN